MTFDEITETPENTAIANNTKPIIFIIDLKFSQFYDKRRTLSKRPPFFIFAQNIIEACKTALKPNYE
ncbi:MAG: hypothetical protein K6C68_04035 [Ruminococcus sp.]|nr:hypothetical protein [Ruminococcus sp.]